LTLALEGGEGSASRPDLPQYLQESTRQYLNSDQYSFLLQPVQFITHCYPSFDAVQSIANILLWNL